MLQERFIPYEIATRLFLSLGIGLLVGFEREWSRKDPGVRTFALVSLLGMLTTIESQSFAWIGMIAVIALVGAMNLGNILLGRELEITTSVALVVTFALGVLVGEGHIFTPTASAIVMTLLLSLKRQLSSFAGTVSVEEVRGAVLLGLIGFVIYPVLPDHPVGPWNLLNPRETWLIVVALAGIGFVNYVLLKVYSARGLYYTAIFGGLINTTAAMVELATSVKPYTADGPEIAVIMTLLIVLVGFARNLVVIAVFSPQAGAFASGPIAAMALFTAVYAFLYRPKLDSGSPSRLTSPISMRKVIGFGLFFAVIQVSSALGKRWFGEAGTVAVSFLGGFISSAGATAAVGGLAAHHVIQPLTAAICTVLTSVASTLINLPIVYRTAKHSGTFRRLIIVTMVTIAIGLLVLGVIVSKF